MKYWTTANIIKIAAYTCTLNYYVVVSTQNLSMKHDSQGDIKQSYHKISGTILSDL